MVIVEVKDNEKNEVLSGYLSDTYIGEKVEDVLKKEPSVQREALKLYPPVPESMKLVLDVIALTDTPTPEADAHEKLSNALKFRIRDLITKYDILEKPVDLDLIEVTVARSETECLGKYKLRASIVEHIKDNLEPPQKETLDTDVHFLQTHKFREWLCDPLGREQFAYRCGVHTEIKWFDAITKTPSSDIQGEDQLGFAFCWSPMGTYFLTFHKKGVWLRARNKSQFEKMMSFDHKGVKHVLFSPNEEFLMTYNGASFQKSTAIDDPAIILWDIASGRKLCVLYMPMYTALGESTDSTTKWPYFQFSHDSRFIAARMDPVGLTIFDAQAAKKSFLSINRAFDFIYLKLPHSLHQFQWSPAENIISIWIPESGDSPSRFVLLRIDSSSSSGPVYHELTCRNLYFVKAVKIHWRHCGEFLALNTTIIRKTGKKTRKAVHQIEIFRVKEKSIPVDTILLENSNVIDFAWEQSSTSVRFAILTSSDLDRNTTIQFYQVPTKNTKEDTQLISTLIVPSAINSFAWSPAGQNFTAFQSGVGNGIIVFGILNDQNKSEIIFKDELTELNTVTWDPSGRCVCVGCFSFTSDESFQYKANVGFRLYSFLGRLMYRYQDQPCNQFIWRPRPPLLLPPSKIEEIHRRLKEYSKKYDAQDDKRRQERQSALKEQRLQKMRIYDHHVAVAKNYLTSHAFHDVWKGAMENLNRRLDYVTEMINYTEVVDVVREQI